MRKEKKRRKRINAATSLQRVSATEAEDRRQTNRKRKKRNGDKRERRLKCLSFGASSLITKEKREEEKRKEKEKKRKEKRGRSKTKEFEDFGTSMGVIESFSRNALETDEIHVADVEKFADLHLEENLTTGLWMRVFGLEIPDVVDLSGKRNSLEIENSFHLLQDLIRCLGGTCRCCEGRSNGARLRTMCLCLRLSFLLCFSMRV